MKILHIINSLDSGGAQALLADLVTHWPEADDHHSVITLLGGDALSGRLREAGIAVGSIRGRRSGLAAARAFQPDVVQTWLYHASLIGSLAVRSVSRAPIVWGLHHTLAGRQSLKFSTWTAVRMLAALSTRLPAAIICCSSSALQSHADHGFSRGKLTLVENGVDTHDFRPDAAARAALRDELGIDPGTKLIGMFARFHPQKDHATMLAAASTLAASMPEVHFVLAGEGIDDANVSLQRSLAQGGIRGAFHLLGMRQDMARLCAAMDLITLTSAHGEALPRIIAEAMACGIPCVATSIGDTAELIGDSGLAVEPGQPAALAHAWRQILALPESEYAHLSARARDRIIERYSLRKMVSGYRAVYAGLVGTR